MIILCSEAKMRTESINNVRDTADINLIGLNLGKEAASFLLRLQSLS
jgi:hypothetical protein